MRSGIVYGTAGMLDGVIDRIREVLPQGETPTIVATGSNAPVIVRYCRNKVLYDKYLLMEGLWDIYQKIIKTPEAVLFPTASGVFLSFTFHFHGGTPGAYRSESVGSFLGCVLHTPDSFSQGAPCVRPPFPHPPSPHTE